MAAAKKKTRRVRTASSGQTVAHQLAHPATKKRVEKAMTRWEKKTRSLIEAVRSSETLTERDFAVRINTRA
jgi:hypothetical protein